MINSETVGQPSTHDMGHLGRRMEHQLVETAIPLCHYPLALDRRHALPCRAEPAGDLHGGTGDSLFDILFYQSLEEDVVAPFLVN